MDLKALRVIIGGSVRDRALVFSSSLKVVAGYKDGIVQTVCSGGLTVRLSSHPSPAG